MKASNTTTPRTLSETSFVTGYVSIAPMAYRRQFWKDVAYAVGVIALFAGIGVMLAWRG